MTDEKNSSPPAQRIPGYAILILVIAVLGFSALVLIQANKDDLNAQEEALTAGSAETLATLGRTEEAIEVYTDLLERSRNEGNFATYYLNRANLYFQQDQYQEALADYDAAISRDEIGSLYQARWNRAQTLARMGRTTEAETGFENFIDEYREELPQFADRARHAIAFLEP